MWQDEQKASFDWVEVQKLLMTFFLPSFWPLSGLTHSQVQCLVL